MARWLAVLLSLCAALACVAAQAQSATPAEISFWESVRDSRNADELRAYLQQYPNGTFKALAESRLRALEAKPVAPQSPPPAVAAPVVAGPKHMPTLGDAWTYRLSYPRLRGQWGQATRPPSTHIITAREVANDRIVDTLSVDGGTAVSSTHTAGATLFAQGASIFSPYLLVLETLPATGRLRSIAINDCGSNYICEAKGRVAGTETVTAPAGKFVATKVIIDQEWRPFTLISGMARMIGGRTLTVWYAPEIGRAVKYSSRLVVGDLPPIEANFDLELVSYQLK